MESKKYDLIFITTFVVSDLVENLVSSIIESNTKVNLLLLVVCQNGNLIDDWNSENISVKTLSVSCMLSLSSARNLAIKYILENNIKASHIMFPDDDSTFDFSFFDRYHSCVSDGVNYIIDIYCENTNILFKTQKSISGKKMSYLDWGAACSVNMLISFDTFLKVGFFDEKLGVGTHYGAGEDNDYFIRSCYSSNGFIYNDSLYNYHPAPKQKYKRCSVKQLVVRFNSYGKGVVYCLCKHHLYYDAFIVCMRALGGGIKSLLLLKINYSIAYFNSSISRFSILISSVLRYEKKYLKCLM